MEGVGGHHGAAQVHRFQQSAKWLVSLCLTLTSTVQQVPAVLGDAEQVDPGAVSVARAAGGLAIHGHCLFPLAG